MSKSNSSIPLTRETPGTSVKGEDRGGSNTLLLLSRYGIFLFFIVFYCVVSFLKPVFLSAGNLSDIFTEVSLVSFVAFGQAIVIAAGAVDLSVGNIAGFGAMLTCYCLAEMDMGVGLSVAVGLAVGCLAGLGNGLLVSRLYMNSLIATLGTMFVLVGFLYMVTGGQSIMMLPESYTDLGAGTFLSVPVPIYFMAAAFVLCYIFTERTGHGRNISMIGGNIEATRLSGIDIKNLTLLAFVLCGLLSTLSGIFLSAKQGLANVDLGERFLLQAFTAAMLGTVIFGGRNIILGTLFGAIFLISLINGMTLLGAGPQWMYFAQGALLLAAILLNYYAKYITFRITLRKK